MVMKLILSSSELRMLYDVLDFFSCVHVIVTSSYTLIICVDISGN